VEAIFSGKLFEVTIATPVLPVWLWVHHCTHTNILQNHRV